MFSALVRLRRSTAFPKTPSSFVDLGTRTITGKKLDNPGISLEAALGMQDSNSSKKISASGGAEARAS
jgi:hypothetical protein